jgi:hypothetical protein
LQGRSRREPNSRKGVSWAVFPVAILEHGFWPKTPAAEGLETNIYSDAPDVPLIHAQSLANLARVLSLSDPVNANPHFLTLSALRSFLVCAGIGIYCASSPSIWVCIWMHSVRLPLPITVVVKRC